MRLAWWVGTVFGIGALPKAPGTWGSVAAALVYGLLFPQQASLLLEVVFFFIMAATFFAGVWAGSELEKAMGHDPSAVVVDEVVGMWLSLFLIPPLWYWILIAFLLFRLFDITKWLGANRIQNLRGGWGIMADDVLAGFWSNVILQIIIRIS